VAVCPAPQSAEIFVTGEHYMGLLTAFNAVLDFANNMKLARSIGLLIAMDRANAMQAIREFVQGCTPQQLDEFESTYFTATAGMITPALRIRSMELYAYLKVAETLHYGQWRGFSASTEKDAL
jgi:hypothetical protein